MPPVHLVGLVAFAVTTSVAATVITTVCELVQPRLVPVTVYVVVPAGVEVGLGQLVQLKPAAGDHV